jgi:hypothetical protein
VGRDGLKVSGGTKLDRARTVDRLVPSPHYDTLSVKRLTVIPDHIVAGSAQIQLEAIAYAAAEYSLKRVFFKPWPKFGTFDRAVVVVVSHPVLPLLAASPR